MFAEITLGISSCLLVVAGVIHYIILAAKVRILENWKDRTQDVYHKIQTLEFKIGQMENHYHEEYPKFYVEQKDLRPFWLECKEELRKNKELQ